MSVKVLSGSRFKQLYTHREPVRHWLLSLHSSIPSVRRFLILARPLSEASYRRGHGDNRSGFLATAYPWVGYGYDARSPTAEWSALATGVVRKLNAHRPWVTKDPRMALTLHAWAQILGTQNPARGGVVCVVTYRHPLAFASSMLK